MFKYMDQESDQLIIAPMTVTNAEYFDQIVGNLRRDGVEVQILHCALPRKCSLDGRGAEGRFEFMGRTTN